MQIAVQPGKVPPSIRFFGFPLNIATERSPLIRHPLLAAGLSLH
jgi:hypothetical protein